MISAAVAAVMRAMGDESYFYKPSLILNNTFYVSPVFLDLFNQQQRRLRLQQQHQQLPQIFSQLFNRLQALQVSRN